jgi:enediyne biosynthesis protein E3
MAQNSISAVLQSVQHVFQKGFSLAEETSSLSGLADGLNAMDKEYLSVAFEGASMSIALNCIEADKEIKPWFDFLEQYAQPHTILYHIGLGWALAQLQIHVTPYLERLDAVERYRVMDGYGYYEAIFRTKKCIHGQQQPTGLNAASTSAYFQGIGRGIWYLNHGQISEAQGMIEKFAPEKRMDLWRGLGIACAYAGGCDETVLKDIMAAAGDYRRQLATGAVMTAICRHKAGYITGGTELACKVLCKQNAAQLVSKHVLNNMELKADTEKGYLNWIAGIESSF